jgi:integrase
MGKLTKSYIDKLCGKPQEKQMQVLDGNNLYLFVTPVGSCKFKYRIFLNGKASWATIGDYPAISLDQARQEAIKIRNQIKTGINPVAEKQKQKNQQITLAEFAKLYIAERLPIVRTTPASLANFKRVIENNVLPIIGDCYLSDIDDSVIKKVIVAKTADGKYGIARLIRNMLKVVLDYAVEQNLLEHNHIKSARAYNMTSNNVRTRFLHEHEIAQMLQSLYGADFIKTKYKIAVHLLLMLLMRKTELIHATWDQVNFEKATFTIHTSKTGAQLIIPLPHQAISLFRIMQKLSSSQQYIFTGMLGHLPLHEHTLNKQSNIINNLIFGNDTDKYFVIHDLRRTGATLLGEMGYPSDYIEVALNHTKGGIKQVYQRSQYLDKRKEMMQDWANKLDSLIGDSSLLPYGKNFVI